MSIFRIIVLANNVVWGEAPEFVDTPIYVIANGYCFPDNQWTDLSYFVLSMWAENLLRNKERAEAEYDLPFMDGPFWIKIKQNGNIVHMEGFDGRADNKIKFTVSTTSSLVFHEMLNAFNNLKKILLRNKNTQIHSSKESILDSVSYYQKRIGNALALMGEEL